MRATCSKLKVAINKFQKAFSFYSSILCFNSQSHTKINYCFIVFKNYSIFCPPCCLVPSASSAIKCFGPPKCPRSSDHGRRGVRFQYWGHSQTLTQTYYMCWGEGWVLSVVKVISSDTPNVCAALAESWWRKAKSEMSTFNASSQTFWCHVPSL